MSEYYNGLISLSLKMIKFVERYNLSDLIQEKIGNLNSPVFIKAIWHSLKILRQKTLQVQMFCDEEVTKYLILNLC